jgi:SAM-dependent methyltransferase
MSIYQFFTDFQEKMYREHSYSMDKLNPVYHYWYYDKFLGQKVFTELGYHNYHKHYAEQFNDLRHSVKKVLEIGVFRGHSLLMWHDYFPNAEIYGVDISFEWHNMGVNAVELCKDKKRIHLLESDACTTQTLQRVRNKWGEDFDIILDDASHHPYHQAWALLNYKDLLKKDGIFAIEDVFYSKMFPRDFLWTFDTGFDLFTDRHYFFDEFIQFDFKPEEIYDYGFGFNDLENVNDLKRNWEIDVRIPQDYSMSFKDVDMQGKNITMDFNDRQAIIFFKRKQ